MTIWVIEVFESETAKLPNLVGYVEKETEQEALDCAAKDLNRTLMNKYQVQARPFSIVSSDSVFWL